MLELLRDRFPNVAVSCSLFFSWTCRLTTYKRFPTGVFLERGEHLVDLVKSFPTFLNFLFKQIANSNEYLLAKFGVDTAENEPL